MAAQGVDEDARLAPDFLYLAPGETPANELAEFLRTQTDYFVETRSEKGSIASRREWFVVGRTNPTTLSLEMLDQWVRWMVMAGHRNGICEFDGWGVQLPSEQTR